MRGPRLNGEWAQAQWHARVEPRKPWQPRVFTLTFRLRPGVAEWDTPQSATLSIPVDQPGCAIAPEYLYVTPDTVSHPEQAVEESAIEARINYYQTVERDPMRVRRWQQRLSEHHEKIRREYGLKPAVPQTP